jgi:hypothetical protein
MVLSINIYKKFNTRCHLSATKLHYVLCSTCNNKYKIQNSILNLVVAQNSVEVKNFLSLFLLGRISR